MPGTYFKDLLSSEPQQMTNWMLIGFPYHTQETDLGRAGGVLCCLWDSRMGGWGGGICDGYKVSPSTTCAVLLIQK